MAEIRGSKDSRLRTPRVHGGIGRVAIVRPTQPSELVLSGERAEHSRVQQHIEYLQSIADLRNLASLDKFKNWRTLLAGNIDVVSSGGIRVNGIRCLGIAGFEDVRLRSPRSGNLVPAYAHGAVASGADYAKLKSDYPTQRYKFYHSFSNQAAANAYVVEVIKEAKTAGISMGMKSFDHAYDGINFYTHHFQEMSKIVMDVYGKHPDAWGATEHFLQGALPGVDVQHIGWVQEPVPNLGHLSHSGRMGRLGGVLDTQGLSEESYRAGCEAAGVRADMPWLLTPGYEAELRATAAELHR